MANIPDVQRAWTVVRRGTPSTALEFKTDWPVPKNLEAGEVLVKIQAAALNPIAFKLMRFLPNFIAKRPLVAEHDFSGVVVNANGTRFSKGDNVFGWIPMDVQMKTHQGALAEYAKVPADHIVIRPPNVTPTQAAGITLTAMTAYQALETGAKIEADQTVFVNGGSTAVGAYAIQYAKWKGAKVVAAASGKNEAFVRKMGADEFIDYTKQPLAQYLSNNPPTTKYQVVYDTVGLIDPSLYTYSAKYLAPNGLFISTGALPKSLALSEIWLAFKTLGAVTIPAWLGNVNRKYAMYLVENKAQDLQAVQKLFADGSMKPVVDSVFEFKDVHKAYERILSGRATGKVVVKIDPTVD
ncbi:hypothetical protein GALMADRAFT_276498 [Galerina marginata CBS 339.88]|uniref:Enoyl reductase (ER) domain-containing protein n=1 Tax=Galerina marginata (strain CBS 339.88) TaxID=685588 RepID=A0A067TF98_GALM3|nr:hypothetical protein GALMADRAFT_276498 [Galerina marginata CBS 339.88]